MSESMWDVIVIGAGPAGSTTAALLARQGVRTLVVEREAFPRFHIGESLLPVGLDVHEILDLAPDEEVFVYKRGARFVCERTNRVAEFDFSEALPGCAPHAWHVERARFDTLVRDRAQAFGAICEHGPTVEDVAFEPDRVVVRTDHGERVARFVVDASGQGRLFARRFDAVEPLHGFGKAAVFTHFEGLTDEALAAIGEGNDIRIMMVDEGWVWMIPLAHRRLSVGLVSQKRGMRTEWLDEFLDASPTARLWTAGATRAQTRMTSNFSFRNTRPYGARYACVGDAACFLDPVFSSGVALAMNGALRLSAHLVAALERGDEGRADLLDPLKLEMERAYDTFASFIHRFYNRRIVENLFFGAPPDGEMRSAVISVLGGDVWRFDNPFQDMLLRSRQQPLRSGGEAAHDA